MREAAKRTISFVVAAEAMGMTPDRFRWLAQQGQLSEVVRVYKLPTGKHGYWIIPERLSEWTGIGVPELFRRNVEFKERRESMRHRGKEVV